jgi:hypothetical protein
MAPRALARTALAGLLAALGALPHGSVSFAPGDLYAKLDPGRYVAGLFRDDGYSLLARTSFRVR